MLSASMGTRCLRRKKVYKLPSTLCGFEGTLKSAYRFFRSETEINTSASEWLQDNYYIVQRAIRQIKEDLPFKYYRQLPLLTTSSSSSSSYSRDPTRIFSVCFEVTEHQKEQLNIPKVIRFLKKFQKTTPLTTGEVWAVPSMLRLCILLDLTEALERILKDETSNEDISFFIQNLRLFDEVDWKEFFEKVSLVERILMEDPSGIYSKMDFATRDSYRNVVEDASRCTGIPETEIALKAVELAGKGSGDQRSSHVGFFFRTPEGRALLRSAVGCTRRRFFISPHLKLVFYLGGIALLAILGLCLLAWYALGSGADTIGILAVILFSTLPVSAVSVDIVNEIILRSIPPNQLPRMDFARGIPQECKTIVVIPTLFGNTEEVRVLVKQLEQHYLGNPDKNLVFALLSDYTDAPSEKMPDDINLLDDALRGIENLNTKYKRRSEDIFHIFHRKRLWNQAENCWMGLERKRGKLMEFNRLLLKMGKTSYTTGEVPANIRYVITLDSDTTLPSGSAARLVATMAHPLNQFGKNCGYSVLQPRVLPASGGQERSVFSKVFPGDFTVDLYSNAVSDVYQDLFGEGSYVGKGIYDPVAFEGSLRGKVPQNSLLSHDLFEGMQGRAGLVSDTVFYEDFPPNYIAWIHRLHRWVRGDWQLLPWLGRKVPEASGGKINNNFSTLDKWKILDNMRRSLSEPALLILLVSGWLYLPGSPVLWTTVTLLILFRCPLMESFRKSLRWPGRSTGQYWLRALLGLVFLPYETVMKLHAVAVTLFRLTITRKNLLEWTAAANTSRIFGCVTKRSQSWEHMYAILIIVPLLVTLLLLTGSKGIYPAIPFLLLWLVSPEVEHAFSRTPRPGKPELGENENAKLRKIAVRTWNFFDTFVGPEDHWLPPDHYQEDPLARVAHRTSPTNIGLYLLTVLSAKDMGYIGLQEFMRRISDTLYGMKKLERYRGHLLNWYDTRTLKPLPPKYVSTVDSGNLSACLLALACGCREMSACPLINRERWLGFLDTLDVLLDITEAMKTDTTELDANLKAMKERVQHDMDDHDLCLNLLVDLCKRELSSIDALLLDVVNRSMESGSVEAIGDLRTWSGRMRIHLSEMMREVGDYYPWKFHTSRPPVIFSSGNSSETVANAWQLLLESLPICPSPDEMKITAVRAGQHLTTLSAALRDLPPSDETLDAAEWCGKLHRLLEESIRASTETEEDLKKLELQIRSEFQKMGYGFLYNRKRKVFHIGFNTESEHLDRNYYDLLASEARLASLIAIARGDVPGDHWIHLSRPLTVVSGAMGLLSWSGTMFEYLMPMLVTGNRTGTLLGQSCFTAVKHQINYGNKSGYPWGISESGYYKFDPGNQYQYRAFGVPGLGYKRGLEIDSVVTPYASLLAISLAPDAVMQNIEKMTAMGMMGRYGFFEAVDFTSQRLPAGREFMIIRSYMAHHQGMIMLSIANFICRETMEKRFFSEPIMMVVKLLLDEQIPVNPSIVYSRPEPGTQRTERKQNADLLPWSVSGDFPVPRVHFLSNGSYGELITDSGGGFSNWKGLDLTRWRADTTLDNRGTWIYLKDMDSGNLWSPTRRPAGADLPDSRIHFLPHKVEFASRNYEISTRMEIIVDPEEDAGIRRIEIVNNSSRQRKLFICSYSEVMLAPRSDDIRHPAFNKLFVISKFIKKIGVLRFHRRRRKADEKDVFLGHMISGSAKISLNYETDRMKFLGRGATTNSPGALSGTIPELSRTTGETLDPVMCLGTELELPPEGSTTVYFVTFCASDKAAIERLAERYSDLDILESAFAGAEIFSRRELATREITCLDLERTQPVLSSLFYPSAALRADPQILEANTLGQRELWRFGISGDNPILLVSIEPDESINLLTELLRVHSFWKKRGLLTDLVILNGEESGYELDLQGKLNRLLRRTGADKFLNRTGGVFLIRTDQVSESELILLKTWARVFLNCGSELEMQMLELAGRPVRLPKFVPVQSKTDESAPTLKKPEELLFFNGSGGFSPDGREYFIFLEKDEWTPSPWINVISNPSVGFIASESGLGCSWAVNSGENRLSPWNNDPVANTPGEAVYLRDEETGDFWSPSPLPVREREPYLITHGAGYTSWEHNSHGLVQKMIAYVLPENPLKAVNVFLQNSGRRNRRISITFYIEPVLGTHREQTQEFIVSEFNAQTNAILACNTTGVQPPAGVFFLASSRTLNGLTTDRTEFLGRSGSYDSPAALFRTSLSGTIRTGLDPCMAMQVIIWIGPGEKKGVTFLLGQGGSREEALDLIRDNMVGMQDGSVLNRIPEVWDNLLKSITVDTPDAGMNIILNRWLLYQTLSCRIWGRSALYQSSGAFGFRDQLQDCMALCNAAPEILRKHILESASMQFPEGDVLHWWHPPGSVGVRTRCSDDLLWLPYATSLYVEKTGDKSILSEVIPFLSGNPLEDDEVERYAEYIPSDKKAALHEHCLRALEKGNTSGSHGLPLMGSHDWNDGMNRVGIEGRGESVWLGWFLYSTLIKYSRICLLLSDLHNFDNCINRAESLKHALNGNTWDGEWYLRGFYDDGSPLGSSLSDECRIDSIAQSWAVLSGAGEQEKTEIAMNSVLRHLVDSENSLLLLLTPPFDKSDHDPGYIKGYPPGIRENGGQYTHAATWVAWAFAKQGRGDIAESLFRLLNPIYHSDSSRKRDIYRVEPYAVAADVYSAAEHKGQGGWTWYTGAAGWLYRLGIEAILGITTLGNNLIINPCIPASWTGFGAVLKRGDITFRITVTNPEGVSSGVASVTLDGNQVESGLIPLNTEGPEHLVTVVMGTGL